MNHSNILLQIPGTPQLCLEITPLSNEIKPMANCSLITTSARGKRNSLMFIPKSVENDSIDSDSVFYWIKEEVCTSDLLVMSH
ncbi:unnamed protein product [Bubo scandiacus]